jgi:cysteine desulfurase
VFSSASLNLGTVLRGAKVRFRPSSPPPSLPFVTMTAVYLDHAATTPMRDEVRAAMEPYASELFGNPSSAHRWGRAASAALEDARAELAASLGARPSEIHFVRGGTESDNLAILGWCGAARVDGARPTLLITRIEHSAVLEPAEHLAAAGSATLRWIDVAKDSSIDLDAVGRASEPPALLSAMWANNETGLELPVAELVATAGARGANVHSDASQALGKVPVSVADVPVDLLTGTGHKINGPRGMGFLFVRDGTPLAPLLYGGGQERALRPGTEDVAAAAGLATAVRLAVAEQEDFAERVGGLRARLEAGLSAALDDVRVNCADARRAPHVSSIGMGGGLDGETLLMALDLEGVAVSGGSACHSGAGKGSHVIAALYGPDDSTATVRFSFGRTTTEADVDRAVEATTTVVRRLRGLS